MRQVHKAQGRYLKFCFHLQVVVEPGGLQGNLNVMFFIGRLMAIKIISSDGRFFFFYAHTLNKHLMPSQNNLNIPAIMALGHKVNRQEAGVCRLTWCFLVFCLFLANWIITWVTKAFLERYIGYIIIWNAKQGGSYLSYQQQSVTNSVIHYSSVGLIVSKCQGYPVHWHWIFKIWKWSFLSPCNVAKAQRVCLQSALMQCHAG